MISGLRDMLPRIVPAAARRARVLAAGAIPRGGPGIVPGSAAALGGASLAWFGHDGGHAGGSLLGLRSARTYRLVPANDASPELLSAIGSGDVGEVVALLVCRGYPLVRSCLAPVARCARVVGVPSPLVRCGACLWE